MVQLRNWPTSYPFATPPDHRRDLERAAQAMVQFADSLSSTFDALHKPTEILRGQSGVQSGGAASYDKLIRVDPMGATMMLALPQPRIQDAGRGFRVACVGSGSIGLRTSATRINGLTQYYYPNARGMFEVRFDGTEFVTFPAPAASWAPIGSATGQALTWDGSTGSFGSPNFYLLPLQAGTVTVGTNAAGQGSVRLPNGATGLGNGVNFRNAGNTGSVRALDVDWEDTVILGSTSSTLRINRSVGRLSYELGGTDRFVVGNVASGASFWQASSPVPVHGVELPADPNDAANKAYTDADIKLHWRGVVGTMSPTQPRYVPENDFEPGNIGLFASASALSVREPGVAGVARRMHVFRYGSPTGPVPSPGPSGTCTGAGAFIYSLERNGTAVATGSVGTLLSYFAVSMVASYAATDQLAIGVRAPSGFTWGPTFLSAHHIVIEGYAN